MTNPVVTRIAPSPTGNLHVGTARAALFNYLYAKQHNGTFIIRIEDTDKARSTKEFEKNILDGLQWLDLKYDMLAWQSKRTELYQTQLQTLLDADKAYLSKEPSKQDPHHDVEVIRIRNTKQPITFHDEIRGDITFDPTELGDFVIARALNDPLYHFTVIVDDHDMHVSHVIRGEDHISNTPRQIMIQEALGLPRPQYAHLPLLLGVDRSKLSKRHGTTALTEYQHEFLPEALLNYLALLGWNPGTDQEIFSMEELVQEFSLERVQKGGAIFDLEKLRSINHQHLRLLSTENKRSSILPLLGEAMQEWGEHNQRSADILIETILERLRTNKEIKTAAENGEYDYVLHKPLFDQKLLIPKQEPDSTIVGQHLLAIHKQLIDLTEPWKPESIKEIIWPYADQEGRAAVLWPFRVALSGREKSPDPFTIAAIIGKEETLLRLRNASDTI